MAKSKLQKESDLSELKTRLAEAKSIVMTEYRGSTVKEIDQFRKTLTKQGVYSKVYKIPLIKKALSEYGVDESLLDFKVPVLLSFSNEEETLPAKLTQNLSKEIKTISLLGGFLDKKFASKKEVLALAELPSKDELRAKLVGTINAPVSGFVNVLSGNIRGFINVLNAVAQK